MTLPTWLAVLLFLFAAWAVLDRLLIPGVRWLLRRKADRAIDEANTRLRIRIQPFKLIKRQLLIDRLRYDPAVLETAEEYARERDMPRQEVMGQVQRYAREIVPAFNAYFYFRIGYWLARNVARLMYRVRLGYSDERALASIAPGSTVVFIMNHRSNMDYVLLAYLAAGHTALSYAAGEWARVWPLRTLVRAMGAYFVRRNSKNPLYRRVLRRYVEMATASGVTQAVYPEGRLSREGTLAQPKLGLLDYMLRPFDPKGERDVVFVPAGINYDRVLEDRTLLLHVEAGSAHEGGGRRAAWTTLRFLARNLLLLLRGRWYRFGYACVNFGSPISARQYLGGCGLDLRELPREQRFVEVGKLAEELMAAVGRVIPVLPVSLIATALLRAEGQPQSELELKAAVHDLIERLRAARAEVYVPRGDSDYLIEVGLRMLTLRRLVLEQDGLFRANPGELFVLRYYANSIRHLFGGSVAGAEAMEPYPARDRSIGMRSSTWDQGGAKE